MVTGEALGQRARVVRMTFDRGKAILLAQKVPDQRRGAWIAAQFAIRIRRGDRFEIGRQQRTHGLGQRMAGKPRDARAKLTCALRRVILQIVDADPGMGIDDAERLVLALQIVDEPCQHRVLDDVGEVAGVEGVAVIHDRYRSEGPRPQRGGFGSEASAGRRAARRRSVMTKPMKPIASKDRPTGSALSL